MIDDLEKIKKANRRLRKENRRLKEIYQPIQEDNRESTVSSLNNLVNAANKAASLKKPQGEVNIDEREPDNSMPQKVKNNGGSHPFFKSKKSGHKKQNNTMLFVESTKKRIFRHIPLRFIPKDSFARDYKGKYPLHILKLSQSGQLATVLPSRNDGDNQSPMDLYIAKHCAEEVDEVYGMSMPLSEKIKLGIFVGLILAILIAIFLIVSTAGGKTI